MSVFLLKIIIFILILFVNVIACIFLISSLRNYENKKPLIEESNLDSLFWIHRFLLSIFGTKKGIYIRNLLFGIFGIICGILMLVIYFIYLL